MALTSAKAIEKHSNQRIEAAAKLREIGTMVLNRMRELLPTIKVTTPVEFKVFADVAIMLYREADRLAGMQPAEESHPDTGSLPRIGSRSDLDRPKTVDEKLKRLVELTSNKEEPN